MAVVPAPQAMFDEEILKRLACPACYGELRRDGVRLICAACRRNYPIVDGIAVLTLEQPAAPEA